MQARYLHVAILASLVLSGVGAITADQKDKSDDKDKKEQKRPTLVVKASPTVSFSPAVVTATVEVRGGRDGDEELYCASTSWDWGDGSISEAGDDCPPYEAGKSTIQRRYSSRHRYDLPGGFKIQFALKRKDKTILANSVNVQVRPGLPGEP